MITIKLHVVENINTCHNFAHIKGMRLILTIALLTYCWSSFAGSEKGTERVLPKDEVAQTVSSVKFDLQHQDDLVLLEWSCSLNRTEKFFRVERSTDKKLWTEVYLESKPFECNKELLYSHIDQIFENGIYYYRLVQADESGELIYSDVKQVEIGTFEQQDILVCPNLTEGYVDLMKFPSDTPIQILDSHGNMVRSFESKEDFDLSDMPSGSYFLKIGDGEEQSLVVL